VPDQTVPCRIDVDAFYDANSLRHAMGVPLGTLDRARTSGRLRYTKCGGRVLYRGEWIVTWLMSGVEEGPLRHRARRAKPEPEPAGTS
jgi:hypothetical protein